MKKLLFGLMITGLAISWLVAPVSVQAAEDKALFVFWRGETDCGRGLKAGLEEMGIQLDITYFDAGRDKAKLKAFLDGLDASAYRFIYTFGTTVSMMTAAAVRDTPIVFGMVTNPLKVGLIESWDKPGGNVTGVSHSVPYADQVAIMLSLGDYQKIGILYNPEEKNSRVAKEELERLLKERGADLVPAGVNTPEGIAGVVAQLRDAGTQLVYLPSDSFVTINAQAIAEQLNAAALPTYASLKKVVTSGALIGIVANYETVGRFVAEKVGQILRGKSPSEVPAQTLPMDQQIILVNGKTVERLGIELPYSVLEYAKILE